MVAWSAGQAVLIVSDTQHNHQAFSPLTDAVQQTYTGLTALTMPSPATDSYMPWVLAVMQTASW